VEAPDRFDRARQEFLSALTDILRNPWMPDSVRRAEVDATVSAIRQIEILSGLADG
tara:strand:+ start:514 stop:681 length:168 start_codon:yes stop_codon:yes gene_type:complete